jgi:hypothetical protein
MKEHDMTDTATTLPTIEDIERMLKAARERLRRAKKSGNADGEAAAADAINDLCDIRNKVRVAEYEAQHAEEADRVAAEEAADLAGTTTVTVDGTAVAKTRHIDITPATDEAWSTAFTAAAEPAPAKPAQDDHGQCAGLCPAYPDADGNPMRCTRKGRFLRDGHALCGQHVKTYDAGRLPANLLAAPTAA